MKKWLLVPAIALLSAGTCGAQSLADAQKMLHYERYEGATRLLQSMLHTDPNNAEAWCMLARMCVHEKQIPALRDSLALMPAAAGGQPFGLCAYGQLLLAEHKKDSAAMFFNKALAATKEKDPAILLAVALALQTGDTTDARSAVDLLNKAIKRDKRDAGIYVALGNTYQRLGDGASSYKAYQDALAQDSRNADALYRLGIIFVSQNSPDMYLKYFNDAVAADPMYAPAWYQLYYHWYFRDVNKAGECLGHYISATDPCVQNDYLQTDLLYASRKYREAIDKAKQLIAHQAKVTEPRLYKLIAYSSRELHDSATALDYMKQYFREQCDTGFVVKDYETMGEIYDDMGRDDSAVTYFVKAEQMQKDTAERQGYEKKLAGLCKRQKDYAGQALWLGRYYCGNTKATNLDLFNWGLADYEAGQYPTADSVFGEYEAKFPDQDFGYYWRARSDAAIDTAMATGMAIPQYMKLIEIDGKDSTKATNRKHLIEAYGYIAAYKANTQKDYTGAIDYFGRLLALDPGNSDAARYVGILKKNLSRMAGKAENKPMAGK